MWSIVNDLKRLMHTLNSHHQYPGTLSQAHICFANTIWRPDLFKKDGNRSRKDQFIKYVSLELLLYGNQFIDFSHLHACVHVSVLVTGPSGCVYVIGLLKGFSTWSQKLSDRYITVNIPANKPHYVFISSSRGIVWYTLSNMGCRVLLGLHGDCTEGFFLKNLYCLECTFYCTRYNVILVTIEVRIF